MNNQSLTRFDANRFYGGMIQDKSFGELFPFVAGGITNNLSGMGGPTDKSTGSFYIPRVFNSSAELQTIYAQSWAARKFIDIPVDDQFIIGRSFEGDDEDTVEKIEAFEDKHELSKKLAQTQKAGRLYGTALLWFVTIEDHPAMPLDVNRLKPGDLKNLIVIDRYSISTTTLQRDPMQPNYMQPISYNINLPNGFSAVVHHSRVCRFDGKEPLTINGFQNYGDQWFGLSELTDILSTIENEDMLAKGISHLSNEASIPVIKLDQFNDVLCSDSDMDLKNRLEMQSLAKSMFRTTFIDKEDSFERVDVTFTGLPDLMDKFAARLSAAADIPQTRFLGRSPAGLNATGDGDMKNYANMITSLQEKKLRPAYEKIDPIIAKLIEVEIPEYTFPSLIDTDDKIQAETLSATSAGLLNLISAGIIDEPEAREVLRQSQLFSTLEDVDAIETLTQIVGTGGDEPVSLNGAQIKSALEIVQQVSSGLLPVESAIAFLTAALPFSEAQAENIVSGIAKSEDVEDGNTTN